MIRRSLYGATMGMAAAALLLAAVGVSAAATPLAPAPDFSLTLLDGKTLSLTDLKGKPVLINFWWSG